MAIKNTTIDTSPTAIYTSLNDSAVTTIYFCNKTTGVVTFNVYVTPFGQPADVTSIVYYGIEVAPTDTYVLDTEKIILANGDAIYASASNADSIVSTVSYVSI
jgi:hypothetical protein